MERDAGVRCRPIEALELARYEVRYVSTDPRPLLVALSYSGEVGRTIEATATAAAFGWRTVAVTGRADGRLAAVSDQALVMSVPTLGFSPGTSTYVAMCTALLRLTAELARSRGRADAAERADDALARAPELAAATLSASEEPAKAAAALLAESPIVTFLGAGPSRASATFGAAKLFEGPQRYGVAEDLEEWAHEQYFVSDANTPIVVVSPSGASRDRALELVDEMAYIRAPVVFVGDTDDEVRARLPQESVVLPIAAGLDEAYSPLLTSLPLALLGFFLSERLGTRSYGFRSDEHEREHYETIHRDTRGEPA
jgi:glucosamine 6-phosphate synthetase-like amidotransferase/phosphosugar isomerase protein